MATPQQFCVRWNSHLGSLGAAFPQLLAGGRFVDCTLACEGRQLSCHRLVLAACSGFFENLLGENPCQHPIIILKDVRFWELQALVDFMYKGEVNVTQEGLQDLLKCAETLQIRGLSGADSALKSLSESVNKPEESCNSNNSNHPLNNVVKEETVPYREEKESTVSKMVDCKPNISDIQDRMIEHNNSVEPDMDSTDSRYSNDAMDEMAMNIKSEVCIDEGPMNKTQSDQSYIKVKNCTLLYEPELIEPIIADYDNNASDNEDPNFVCPPQLHYNKEVMAIIPCQTTFAKRKSPANNDETSTVSKIPPKKVHARHKIADDQKRANLDPAFVDANASFLSETDVLMDSVRNVQLGELNMKNDLMNSRTGRTGSFRTYDNESLWNALMDIKGGSSIYRASQVYNVPRKTLRNWMKRWDIKSSYPMPRQLKQFVDNMKSRKQT